MPVPVWPSIAIKGDEASYHYNLAGVHRRNEKVDEAIAELSIALRLEPMMAQAWYDIGHMHRLNRDNDKAIAAFNRYLELTKGKDRKADARVVDQIEALGGKAGVSPKTPAKSKSKSKKRGKKRSKSRK